MTLPDGFTAIPAGKVAAIVTVLEMTAPPADRPDSPAEPGWHFAPVEDPGLAWYRDLYRRIGGDYLWYSRLALPDETLAETLRHPAHVLHALSLDGAAEGLVEIDFRRKGEAEIVFFGVTGALVGTRAARFMMSRAIALVFARGVERLWLHTNTLDHPRALAFYRRSGFTPIAQEVEIADDPRLTGLYDRAKAPHIPIFEPR